MRQLYQQAYKRVAQRCADSSGSLPQALQGFQHEILHRLPREDLKQVLKNPCFVTNPQTELATVQASKNLRAHAFILQSKTCFKCPHKSSCPLAGKQVPLPLPKTAVQDTLLYAGSLMKSPEDTPFRIFNSAYKTVDLFGLVLDDLKAGAEETKQFEEHRLKAAAEREHEGGDGDEGRKEERGKKRENRKEQGKEPAKKNAPFKEDMSRADPNIKKTNPRLNRSIPDLNQDQQDQDRPRKQERSQKDKGDFKGGFTMRDSRNAPGNHRKFEDDHRKFQRDSYRNNRQQDRRPQRPDRRQNRARSFDEPRRDRQQRGFGDKFDNKRGFTRNDGPRRPSFDEENSFRQPRRDRNQDQPDRRRPREQNFSFERQERSQRPTTPRPRSQEPPRSPPNKSGQTESLYTKLDLNEKPKPAPSRPPPTQPDPAAGDEEGRSGRRVRRRT